MASPRVHSFPLPPSMVLITAPRPLLPSSPSSMALTTAPRSLLLSSFARPAMAAPRRSVSVSAELQKPEGGNESGRRIWRPRKLHEDRQLGGYVHFDEWHHWYIQPVDLIPTDGDFLKRRVDNKFALINEIFEVGRAHAKRNPNAETKPSLHALSDRMNDAGAYRSDGYTEKYYVGPNYRAWRPRGF